MPRRQIEIPPERISEISTRYRERGWSVCRLSSAYGLSPAVIRRELTKAGIRLRTQREASASSASTHQDIGAAVFSRASRGPHPKGCWEWTGYIESTTGYGKITFRRKTMGVHRAAFLSTGAEIPSGMDVCHRCDNRRCVNPSHLFVGTRLTNMIDCHSKGRIAKGSMFPNRSGDASASAKLTLDQAITIKRVRPRGQSAVEMAEGYGISVDTVRKIISGKTWRNVQWQDR